MIENHNLQFTNASQLNDPFDCHPKLMDYTNVSTPRLSGFPKEWKEMIEENDALNRRDGTWLCSLSKVNDSLLMWSHYCRNHTGICIGVDIDKIIECTPQMFGQIVLKPLVLDVQYQDLIESRESKHGYYDKCKYQWTTKAKDWEYEQEVRLVIPKPSDIYFALTKEQEKEQAKQPNKTFDWREIHCYLPLLGDCFDSILFGINTKPNEREDIIRYVRKKLNPQIKLFQMHVDANAFRLKPESL